MVVPRTIVLVGFMAAGKSTVGRRLAHALDWRFRDLDDEIERHTGLRVPDIFRARGEAAFRQLERELTDRLLREPQTVVAPGGGWAALPGVMDALPDGVLTIWLRVSAEEAVRRAQAEGRPRPLLDADDALATAKSLLAARAPAYAMAHAGIDVDDRAPDEVVEAILAMLKNKQEHEARSD
jgi:shikimate kinase